MDAIQIVVEPTRRRLLQLVWSEERAAGELAGYFPVTFGAVSQHLGVLRQAGVRGREKERQPQDVPCQPGPACSLRHTPRNDVGDKAGRSGPCHGGGRVTTTIKVERYVKAPPDKVYEYLTDSEGWAKWQGIGATIDSRPGGNVSHGDGQPHVRSRRVRRSRAEPQGRVHVGDGSTIPASHRARAPSRSTWSHKTAGRL